MNLTPIVEDPDARCSKCSGQTELIHGEGIVVCRACVLMLGRVANEPGSADERVVDLLEEIHGDVVILVRTRDPKARFWHWRAHWPRVEGRA